MKTLNTILIVCAMGFGSSFIMRDNVRKIAKEFGLEDVEVNHSDIENAPLAKAGLIICGTDIAHSCEQYDSVIALNNLFDLDELRDRLAEYLKTQGLD